MRDIHDRLIDSLLTEVLGDEKPPDLTVQILRRAGVGKRGFPVWKLVLGTAAAVLLVLTLQFMPPKPQPPVIPFEPAVVSPARGAVIQTVTVEEEIDLGGYCRVSVRPDSILRVEGEARAEQVFLEQGAVECEVESGVGAFAVRTDVGTVSVKGTQFVVRLINDKGAGNMNVKRMFVKVLAGSVLVTGMWGDVLLAQGQETTLPEPAAVAATEPVPVSKKQQKLAAKLAAEIAKLEATEKELIAESIGTGMAIPKGLKDELQKTYAGADTAIKAMAAALPPEELRSIRQYRETVRWIRHLVGDLSERYEHLDDLLDDDDLPEDNKLIAGMRKNLTALAAKITEALKAWNEGDRLKGLKARAEARVLMVQSEQQMESMEFEFWFTELRGFAEQHPGDANVTAAFKVLEAEYKRVAELRAARQTMILKMVALESQQEILDLQMDELDKRLGEMEEQEDAGHEQFEAAAEIMEEQIERLEEDDEDHDDGEEDDDDGEEDDDDGEEAPAPEEDVF